jgi:hypothetical protein
VEKNQRTNLASVVIACYLLTSSIKPRHYRKKKTYVSFTVDPDRRVQEHNGLHNRGSLYTENFRPWLPACVVLGFKSLASLKNGSCRFKWPGAVTLITRTSVEHAWHHPPTSTCKYVKA